MQKLAQIAFGYLMALAISLAMLASVGRGAIAHVATVSAGSTGGNTVTTSGVDTTGANLIVLVSSWFSTAAPTVSDSKSNTYTGLTARVNGTNKVQIYYCASPTVGSGHTFTLTGTSSFPTVSATAVSGAHASPYDQETGSGTATPGTLTPSEDGCLVVTGAVTASSTPALSSGGFSTTATAFAASNHMGGGISYLIQTTAAAANPTWTSTSASVMASFKQSAGGGGSTVRRQAVVVGSLTRPYQPTDIDWRCSPFAAFFGALAP